MVWMELQRTHSGFQVISSKKTNIFCPMPVRGINKYIRSVRILAFCRRVHLLSVCHWLLALDFMCSVPLEIRPVVLTCDWELVRAEQKPVKLWLEFIGNWQGNGSVSLQQPSRKVRMRMALACLLKEFEISLLLFLKKPQNPLPMLKLQCRASVRKNNKSK